MRGRALVALATAGLAALSVLTLPADAKTRPVRTAARYYFHTGAGSYFDD